MKSFLATPIYNMLKTMSKIANEENVSSFSLSLLRIKDKSEKTKASIDTRRNARVRLHCFQTINFLSQINVYVSGGFVRDLLLKLPNLDIDLVCEGYGVRFADLLGEVSLPYRS